MINIKQNLSSIFSILKLVTIIMFLMSLSIADPLHLTQGKHTRPWNPKIKNLPPSHFFRSDLSSQCTVFFYFSCHYIMEGGILKAKATAHANFMGIQGLHRKHWFWGGFENFKGMKKKKRPDCQRLHN